MLPASDDVVVHMVPPVEAPFAFCDFPDVFRYCGMVFVAEIAETDFKASGSPGKYDQLLAIPDGGTFADGPAHGCGQKFRATTVGDQAESDMLWVGKGDDRQSAAKVLEDSTASGPAAPNNIRRSFVLSDLDY